MAEVIESPKIHLPGKDSLPVFMTALAKGTATVVRRLTEIESGLHIPIKGTNIPFMGNTATMSQQVTFTPLPCRLADAQSTTIRKRALAMVILCFRDYRSETHHLFLQHLQHTAAPPVEQWQVTSQTIASETWPNMKDA